MTRVINAIPMKPLWCVVRVDNIRKNAGSLTILYKAMPESYEPEQDTMAVARAVLKELVAEGKQPAADWTTLQRLGDAGRTQGGRLASRWSGCLALPIINSPTMF